MGTLFLQNLHQKGVRTDVEVVTLVFSVKRGLASDLDSHEWFLVVGDVAVGGSESQPSLQFVVVVAVWNVVVGFGLLILDASMHPETFHRTPRKGRRGRAPVPNAMLWVRGGSGPR